MSSILKGAIYCRVSTDEQESSGTSLQSQKLSCLKFASDNNLIVTEEYCFLEQYSGGFLDRPQLTYLLLLASKGLIDFVIFTKRDRVARDQYVFQKIMKDLQDYNVKIFYSEEKLTGDSAMDSFMGSTIIGFAAWEREQIKLRTNTGKRQFAKNNKWPFGHTPYGYIKNQKTKELEIFEEEKEVILRIVKNYLEDNMTLGAIAKSLENDKILPPSNTLKKTTDKLVEKELKKNSIYFWSISNVQRLLNRVTIYTGVYQAFKKEYKKTGNNSVFAGERPKQDWIEIKVPKILTAKQVELIKEKLENNRKYSKKRSVRKYMLQGKLFCDCESPIFHNFVGYYNNAKNLRNYRCGMHKSSKFSKERLCSNHISGLKIEGIVIDTLRELFLDSDYIFETAVDRLIPNVSDNKKDRYSELLSLINNLTEKHKRNEELYIDGLITKDRFNELKKSISEKEDDYKKEIDKEFQILKNEQHKDIALKTIKEISFEIKEEIETFFDNASYDDLKDLVNIVIDKIIVSKDKNNPVRIIMKIPCNISYSEKYYENEFVEYTDEIGVAHNICSLDQLKPKLLKLDNQYKPLKYRTVEFKDNEDDELDLENNEKLFLKKIKEKYNLLCKYDHFKKSLYKALFSYIKERCFFDIL